jgi:ABC-type glycerol-3-phosphate transport system substrate-binding protein
MFIGGNLAIMFSYSYDLPTIKAQAPKLNFSIAKFPQIEGNPPTNINFANYWVEVVSKKSSSTDAAWDFVQFITKEEQAKTYLEKTKRPTALRSLVETQKTDNEIGVFADQVLTAKSWYQGKNVKAAEDAIAEMINNALIVPSDKIQEVVNTAAAKVQQTIY